MDKHNLSLNNSDTIQFNYIKFNMDNNIINKLNNNNTDILIKWELNNISSYILSLNFDIESNTIIFTFGIEDVTYKLSLIDNYDNWILNLINDNLQIYSKNDIDEINKIINDIIVYINNPKFDLYNVLNYINDHIKNLYNEENNSEDEDLKIYSKISQNNKLFKPYYSDNDSINESDNESDTETNVNNKTAPQNADGKIV
jgi:hypothetical protein